MAVIIIAIIVIIIIIIIITVIILVTKVRHMWEGSPSEETIMKELTQENGEVVFFIERKKRERRGVFLENFDTFSLTRSGLTETDVKSWSSLEKT